MTEYTQMHGWKNKLRNSSQTLKIKSLSTGQDPETCASTSPQGSSSWPKIYKHWLDQGVTEWFWIKQTMLGILAPPFQGGN